MPFMHKEEEGDRCHLCKTKGKGSEGIPDGVSYACTKKRKGIDMASLVVLGTCRCHSCTKKSNGGVKGPEEVCCAAVVGKPL